MVYASEAVYQADRRSLRLQPKWKLSEGLLEAQFKVALILTKEDRHGDVVNAYTRLLKMVQDGEPEPGASSPGPPQNPASEPLQVTPNPRANPQSNGPAPSSNAGGPAEASAEEMKAAADRAAADLAAELAARRRRHALRRSRYDKVNPDRIAALAV